MYVISICTFSWYTFPGKEVIRLKVISVKNNSVRIRSGIVTFDVLYDTQKNRIIIPAHIFIIDDTDFNALRTLVKAAYVKSKERG
jgi:hypothetical protein